MRIRLYGDMQNIDPAFRISNNDETIIDAVFSKLVGYGPGSYELKNDLAEKIEQSEDGKTITFKLREGVMWPKGYGELTAEDVKYSYERIADPALKAAYADDWAALDHVEVIDKYNGKIILKEPFAALWKTTLPIGSGAIVSKKWVEEVGVEKFATDVIGTGPYYIADWQQKQKITLKRNPDYYGEPPAFDEIHFFPMEDDKTAEIALEAGEIDFGRISTSSIQRYESGGDVKLIRKPSLRFRWIGMNVENPKLQDINVRQAIRYALDVPGIVKATYMGQADVEYALIPPGSGRLLEGCAPLRARRGQGEGVHAEGRDRHARPEDRHPGHDRVPQLGRDRAAEPEGDRHQPDHQPAGFQRVLVVGRGRAGQRGRAVQRQLQHAARSVVGDHVVHVRTGRHLELGALVQQGIR